MFKIGNVEVASDVVLGPMAGVTDLPFRVICREFGCELAYSEMISSKAMHYSDKKTAKLLEKGYNETYYAVQIFGSEPDIMAECAQKVENLHIADIIDINMGCPAPKVANNGDGSALMKNPELASEIIKSVTQAVNLPVTVKFRKGWDNDSVNAVSFAQMAEKSGVKAITIHGRTRAQYYSGNADWDIIRDVKKAVSVPVIGNGDVFTRDDVLKIKDYTGCDGVMVARGTLGNPFIFSNEVPDKETVIKTALRHLELIVEHKGEYVGIREARKHMSWYIKGMYNAARYKDAICAACTYKEMKNIMLNILS